MASNRVAAGTVGPRRAWTVPVLPAKTSTPSSRPPARVDGPGTNLPVPIVWGSAPGARGRSPPEEDLAAPGMVGPRRAWTVPRPWRLSRRRSCRPPARVDGPDFGHNEDNAALSAPGARGRSPPALSRVGFSPVGPRRAWTVPRSRAASRSSSSRPPARVDGPSPGARPRGSASSAPGARGRSPRQGHQGRARMVGPRRAWAVPRHPSRRHAPTGRPPARVDGPWRACVRTCPHESAPGARGRSRGEHRAGGRVCVGPRRAWTVPGR